MDFDRAASPWKRSRGLSRLIAPRSDAEHGQGSGCENCSRTSFDALKGTWQAKPGTSNGHRRALQRTSGDTVRFCHGRGSDGWIPNQGWCRILRTPSKNGLRPVVISRQRLSKRLRRLGPRSIDFGTNSGSSHADRSTGPRGRRAKPTRLCQPELKPSPLFSSATVEFWWVAGSNGTTSIDSPGQ